MGEFDQTIGFSLMSVFINTYLTGLIMSQFFTYWNAMNTTQAGAVVYMSWNFANPRVVASKDSLPQEKPHLNPVIQNNILIGFLVATSVVACGTGVAAAMNAWILSEPSSYWCKPISEVNLALQCGIDVIIADITSSTWDLDFFSHVHIHIWKILAEGNQLALKITKDILLLACKVKA
ncbi:hypothetical protein B0H14DRAFT_2572996 [Mycena olivaceomarginata]|nr:hypothetical protein B0H14DRAFT_2572996 [Mycena olivaceomarginata]